MKLLLKIEKDNDLLSTNELFDVLPNGVSIVEQDTEEGQEFVVSADVGSVAATEIGILHKLFETSSLELLPSSKDEDDQEEE